MQTHPGNTIWQSVLCAKTSMQTQSGNTIWQPVLCAENINANSARKYNIAACFMCKNMNPSNCKLRLEFKFKTINSNRRLGKHQKSSERDHSSQKQIA